MIKWTPKSRVNIVLLFLVMVISGAFIVIPPFAMCLTYNYKDAPMMLITSFGGMVGIMVSTFFINELTKK